MFLGRLSSYLRAFKPVEFSLKGKKKTTTQNNYPHSIIKSLHQPFSTDPLDRSRNSRLCPDQVALLHQHRFLGRKISQWLNPRQSLEHECLDKWLNSILVEQWGSWGWTEVASTSSPVKVSLFKTPVQNSVPDPGWCQQLLGSGSIEAVFHSAFTPRVM